MNKISLSLLLVFVSGIGFSQQQIVSTNQFSVEANHKTLFVFSINQLDSLTSRNIGDVIMVNSKGEEKNVRKNVKGVLLKDVLNKVSFNVSKPRELHKYYFVLEATDNYRAVLSYNEIFNTDNLYIITESNGVSIQQSHDRIEIVALSKPGVGHIYMKGLMRLIADKVD